MLVACLVARAARIRDRPRLAAQRLLFCSSWHAAARQVPGACYALFCVPAEGQRRKCSAAHLCAARRACERGPQSDVECRERPCERRKPASAVPLFCAVSARRATFAVVLNASVGLIINLPRNVIGLAGTRSGGGLAAGRAVGCRVSPCSCVFVGCFSRDSSAARAQLPSLALRSSWHCRFVGAVSRTPRRIT